MSSNVEAVRYVSRIARSLCNLTDISTGERYEDLNTYSSIVASRLHQIRWQYVRPLSAWWRHQMETFSALMALCEGNPPITGELPSQRPLTWRFIYAWTNGWTNKRDAGDLRRHHAHYDITVMAKRPNCRIWADSQTSSVQPLKFGEE